MGAGASARPMYETDETRAAEERVATLIAERWRCDAVHMPMKSRIDFALYRNRQLEGFAEVRIRKTASTDYPDYMVALEKIVAGLNLARATARKFLLVVEFTDGVFYCNVLEVQTSVDILDIRDGGMSVKARGDWQDREPCLHIPMTFFKRLQ